MSLIAQRLNSIKPSPTIAVAQKARDLVSQGKNIISLGIGEPDFDTPDNIKEAAIRAIKEGDTKYTPIAGTTKLKKAVQEKFKRENSLSYDLNEIIVSTGGKQVLYNLFMASLNPGDEVIIPAPYWVSYPDMVAIAGGEPVFIPCEMEDGFKLTPENLAQKITTKTKWLVINSPSNPSGAAYHKEELEALADTLRKFPHVYIMCDDIYEHITFDGFKFYTLAEVAPDLKDRVFVVNGVSKAYAMTGWRIGYGAGPKELVDAMTTIQSQSTSGATSISQAASVEALNGIQDFIKPNNLEFCKKRDLALSIINSTPGLKCYKPEGAFYLFPSCKELFRGEIKNSNDLASYLLEDAGVAVVPGIGFGLDGYFRISYALSKEELERACLKIKDSCSKLYTHV